MTISTSFKNMYEGNSRLLLSQATSKLEGTCDQDADIAEQKFYDQSAPFEVEAKQDGINETNNVRPNHARRRLIVSPFVSAPIYTKQESARSAIDIGSTYMRQMARAFNRKKDTVKIEALLGTAYTGKDGLTPIELPSEQTIAVDFDESGSPAASNLTIGKLRQARALFDLAEMDTDELSAEGKLYFAASPKQRQALLRSTSVTSSDFNEVKALVDGRVDTFMGFKFVWSTRLPVNTNVRSCIAYSWDAAIFGTGVLVNRVDEIPTKQYATQLYTEMEMGATRLEEEQVIEVLCNDTL